MELAGGGVLANRGGGGVGPPMSGWPASPGPAQSGRADQGWSWLEGGAMGQSA